MRILILGSGGREHALAFKIAQSKNCTSLFIAPGNAGTSSVAENVSIGVLEFEKIRDFCIAQKIELLLVGPEEPLVKGIVEFLKSEPSLSNLMIIGPGKIGAQLEGSKAFAKDFMMKHNIPTASYHEFSSSNFEQGVEYIKGHSLPIVLKADGLAAGKGVLICETHEQALTGFSDMIQEGKFGAAGSKVVIEQFLKGIEMSVFVLTDGKDYVILPSAKDYKRIGEGDTGLNTGGMGAVSPVPFVNLELMQKIEQRIIKPTIEGFAKDGIDYCGFVFIGLMVDTGEPYVIEYNCRMGDPETEVVIPRLKTDLLDLLVAASKGEIGGNKIEVDTRTACTIVAVSGGYPGDYKKGFPITGIRDSFGDSLVFHMGTSNKDSEILTAGGRVFCVTSFADSIQDAAARSRTIQEKIQFEDKVYRADIGYEFFKK
jgi:phosphoribosylamine--glycine ligase